MNKNKPNILFLMTDHQRADVIGMKQCGREVTPNLNRLAEQGTCFTRAYNTCPLCVPARTALATGIYPTKNGVTYNDWEGRNAKPLEPIHRTLKNAGYCVGHVGVDHIRTVPNMREQNFDYFINQKDYEAWADKQGITREREPADLVAVKEEVEERLEENFYSGSHVSLWSYSKEQFQDFYYLEHALKFLDMNRNQPFALFTYLWAPHPPLKVPKEYANLYDPEKLVLPSNINEAAKHEPKLRRQGVPAQLAKDISLDQWRETWAAHLALTTMADDILGQLIHRLEDMGELENTIVVFTSDHGDHMGQHRMYQKMEMYEEAIKVPLLMKLPGGTKHTVLNVVSHLDIKPTLCELLGLEIGDTDGISLVKLLQGGSMEERPVFSQYSGNPGYGTIRRCVVTERYKYIYDNLGEHELYDLSLDPHEMNNVSGHEEYRPILEELYKECREFHQKHDDYYKWRNMI